MTSSIAVENVTMRFDGFEALRDVSLSVGAGDYAVLLGPSGCGKSTLLSVLGGFLTPTQGRVRLGGTDVTNVPPAKRATTTMFQDYALFPHMTLADNVGFGLRMRGVKQTTRRKRAAEMLALVGLPEAGGKRPHELSGGQRQRVALARALVVEPEALLLDEPLGALDLKLRRAMQDELKQIQQRIGTTFIHVTHDQEEAMAIADTIVVMNAGQIEDAGAPERIYGDPATAFAASFMGDINMIKGQGDGTAITTPLGTVPHSQTGAVLLAVRPEHLCAPGAVPLGTATVRDVAFFGSYCRVRLNTPAGDLTANMAPANAPARGDTISLAVDPDHIKVFPT
ncbi:MAG: ABC transporter ATP-binding protein [Sedimentitalea sp.]